MQQDEIGFVENGASLGDEFCAPPEQQDGDGLVEQAPAEASL